jgi:hypothetical protein
MVYLILIKVLGGDMYLLRYDCVSLDEYDTHGQLAWLLFFGLSHEG